MIRQLRAVKDEEAVRFRSAARSHVGRTRTINEDRVFECPEARVWAVADGMGGHAGGDLAAQAVINRLRAVTAACCDPTFDDVLTALNAANADIRERNAQVGSTTGTTVAAVAIDGAVAHIAWAGDSRVYSLYGGALKLLTTDHSVVQELVDAGALAVADAERHPQSHVVTRALGVGDDPQLQVRRHRLVPGDRLLICTDGLSRSLATKDIRVSDIDQLADGLLWNALHRDGSDNISLLIVERGPNQAVTAPRAR